VRSQAQLGNERDGGSNERAREEKARRLWGGFDEGLRRDGINLADNSLRMRLDRVLNPRLRCPTTEQTLRALGWALEWSIVELEAKLEEAGARSGGRKAGGRGSVGAGMR
jgi:hypothetical protein